MTGIDERDAGPKEINLMVDAVEIGNISAEVYLIAADSKSCVGAVKSYSVKLAIIRKIVVLAGRALLGRSNCPGADG